jgi:hypothetical protein
MGRSPGCVGVPSTPVGTASIPPCTAPSLLVPAGLMAACCHDRRKPCNGRNTIRKGCRSEGVREAGLEPARPKGHEDLNPVTPIPASTCLYQ